MFLKFGDGKSLTMKGFEELLKSLKLDPSLLQAPKGLLTYNYLIKVSYGASLKLNGFPFGF